MKITILTLGSRGDVQPYLALGVALKEAGFAVKLASHAIFERWIRSYGIDFALVRFNPREIVHNAEFRSARSNIVRLLLTTRRLLGKQFIHIFDDFWSACKGAKMVIASPTVSTAYECAHALRIPLILASLQPLIPTRNFSSFFLPPLPNLGGTFNRSTHWLFNQVLWQNVRTSVNHWRMLRLRWGPAPRFGPYRAMESEQIPQLVAISPSVIPEPADWKPWHTMTGYWFLNTTDGFRPEPELVRFLDDGIAPIYFGFGSVSPEQPDRIMPIIVNALAKLGQRGIISTGWGSAGSLSLPETIFSVEDVPHDWLFPQMAALGHHGGAGTTAAGIRAGVPSVLIPFGGDQHHWKHHLLAMGVTPPSPSIDKLTVDALVGSLELALNDPDLKQRADNLGQTIRSEDGLARAVGIIQHQIR